MQVDNVRVELEDTAVTAIWPLSNTVEIMEDLPDGGAKVRVHLQSGIRVGRISASTLVQRADWDVNLKVHISRAAKEADEEVKRKQRFEEFKERYWADTDPESPE